MLNLRVESPYWYDPRITAVYLGDHYIAFRNELGRQIGKLAPIVACAFATIGLEPTPRRVRKDAGPKGVERYLKRHQSYFDSQARKRKITELLTPFVTEVLIDHSDA